MSYPKNLTYALNRLSGYSTTLVKVRANQNATASSGDVISFDLPANTLLDLDSLRICGTMTREDLNIRHTESIARQVIFEAGGTIISGASCDHLPIVWNTLNDFYGADKESIRSVYQKGAEITASVGTVSEASEPFFISGLLGFSSSVKPNFVDTSLFPGTLRCSIRVNDKGAFAHNSTTTNVKFSLSDLYMLVKVCSIDDGMYFNILSERLRQGAIELPFTNITSFLAGDRTGTSANTQFSLTSQSVDLLLGTVLRRAGTSTADNGFLAGEVDTDIDAPAYFVRGAQSGSAPKATWVINGVQHPSYGQMSAMDAFSESLNALGVLNDTVGASNSKIVSSTLWEQKFFASFYRLNHPDSDNDSRLVSGLNCLGTNTIAQWQYEQTTSETFQPFVAVFSTAILKLGAGRTMAITF